MDDQSLEVHDQTLRPRRRHGKFQRVPPDEIGLFELSWLEPIPGVPKIDFKKMMWAIKAGSMDLWRLVDGPQGIAVTYPKDGTLFIYYLHATGLFGKLTREELLAAAEGEGLKGMTAATNLPGMVVILTRIGFEITGHKDGMTDLELV